jgi:hypothetical protein
MTIPQSSHDTDPDNEEAPQYYYMLMRVGFQEKGPAKQPRNAHTKKAQCLTVGDHQSMLRGDGLGAGTGTALGWMKCQDEIGIDVSKHKIDRERRATQLFHLKADGSLMDRFGRCMRRVACSDGDGHTLGQLYDLGDCKEIDGPRTVKIKASRSMGNSLDHLSDMGYLANAVKIDACHPSSICGPYQLTNPCLGTLCGASYQAAPGWTKMASQYVGDDAVNGRSLYGASGAAAVGSLNKAQQIMNVDMSGIGPTPTRSESICGSYVSDSPAIDSYFYVLTAKAANYKEFTK